MPQRGLDDQRIAVTPIVAFPGEQPDALAIALDDQAIAVALDFVKLVRPVKHRGTARRDARVEPAIWRAPKI